MKLGVELCEIKNWQCCGGVYVTAGDEIATKLSSVRALAAARAEGMPLVTVCSACHNVIKQTNNAMRGDADFAERVNRYMAQDKNALPPYHGETEVMHYLELLRDFIGFDKRRTGGQQTACGQKGCRLLRLPAAAPRQGHADGRSRKSPHTGESYPRVGREPVVYPACATNAAAVISRLRTRAEAKKAHARKSAAAHGADVIVTACPLCRYNLVRNESAVPVVYFTEMLAEALGITEE